MVSHDSIFVLSGSAKITGSKPAIIIESIDRCRVQSCLGAVVTAVNHLNLVGGSFSADRIALDTRLFAAIHEAAEGIHPMIGFS